MSNMSHAQSVPSPPHNVPITLTYFSSWQNDVGYPLKYFLKKSRDSRIDRDEDTKGLVGGRP